MANDPKKRSAICDSRCHAMAGHAVDGLLFPGRDGFALPYLCCQLENSAKRIHRARSIRRSLRLPRPRYVDCADLDCAEITIQKSLIMVSLLQMPQTVSNRVSNETAPSPEEKTGESMIEIENLDFAYGTNRMLHDIDLSIPARAVTAFIGPSGCGKTTLLRCLNRMNDLIDGARITSGSIHIEGIDINSPGVDVVDLRRRVGMVFQKSNPFPKSIYDNIAYGLRIAGVTKRSRLDEAVEKSLRSAALWDEVKDRMYVSGYGL